MEGNTYDDEDEDVDTARMTLLSEAGICQIAVLATRTP